MAPHGITAAPTSVGPPDNQSSLGERWAEDPFGRSPGNTAWAPNPLDPDGEVNGQHQGPGRARRAGVHGMSRYHSGGASVTMADGSVRVPKASIAVLVTWALGSRAQKEVVSSDPC